MCIYGNFVRGVTVTHLAAPGGFISSFKDKNVDRSETATSCAYLLRVVPLCEITARHVMGLGYAVQVDKADMW